MMERGQKALEREQVRRDCNDLTEKLEALTKQYPRQVPINVSFKSYSILEGIDICNIKIYFKIFPFFIFPRKTILTYLPINNYGWRVK